MPAYLDTSAVVSLFRADAHSARILAFVRLHHPILLVSDLAGAEFAASIKRFLRTGEMRPDEAAEVFRHFDAWIGRAARRVETLTADIDTAAGRIRRLDMPLRAPDAIHVAAANRLGATLVTFDAGMATAARALAVPVAAA